MLPPWDWNLICWQVQKEMIFIQLFLIIFIVWEGHTMYSVYHSIHQVCYSSIYHTTSKVQKLIFCFETLMVKLHGFLRGSFPFCIMELNMFPHAWVLMDYWTIYVLSDVESVFCIGFVSAAESKNPIRRYHKLFDQKNTENSHNGW